MRQRSVPEREISPLALLPVRLMALLPSILAGVAIGLGCYREAMSDDPLSLVLVIGISLAVMLGMGTLWYLVLGVGSHSGNEDSHRKVMAGCVALLLGGVGIGTSGVFLVTLLAGQSALVAYRLAYLGNLSETANLVSIKGGAGESLIALFRSGAASLRGSAQREDLDGVQKAGLRGQGSFHFSEVQLSESAAFIAESMDNAATRRKDLLARAFRHIDEARHAATSRDGGEFARVAGLAGREIGDADGIDLAQLAGGFGRGVIVSPKAKALVDEQVQRIKVGVARAEDDRRPLFIPAYAPKSEREAVISNPPLLGWTAAVVIESLPAIGYLVLLLLWRSRRDDDTGAASAL